MNQLPVIRIRPTDEDYLSSQEFLSGVIFYNKDKNTLTVMDGMTRGGYELLRADLSNIAGGSGGSGNINFGLRSITAQSFSGDGSNLTNLPIPANLATTDFVNQAIAGVTIGPATETTLGTIKVGIGLSISQDGTLSADAVSSIDTLSNMLSISFVAGVAISEFSNDGTMADNSTNAVPTEAAVRTYVASAINELDLSASGVVNEGAQGRLAFYATSSNEVSETASTLTWNNSTSTLSVENLNGNSIEATTLSADSATLTNVTVEDTLTVNNIINPNLGVPRWTSGSDFIIDAAGEINVSGSKIVNLGTPINNNDAANKAYVDSAASAFQGGTVAGKTDFTDNTASTSITTGAVTVSGGIGVGGSGYFGGVIYSNGSPVLTSLSGGYNGGIISGTLFINNNTASTSPTSGALRVAGGVGIAGNLYVNTDGYFNGIRVGRGSLAQEGSDTNLALGGGTGNDVPLALISSGTSNIAIGFKALSAITTASNNIAVGRNAMSNKTAGSNNTVIGYNALTSGTGSNNSVLGSGALGVSTGENNTAVGFEALHQSTGNGNIGIGYSSGRSLVTGNYNVIIGNSLASSIDGTSNNIIISDGEGNIRIQSNSDGTVTIPATVSSTSTITGALVVGGGVGIAGDVYVGGTVNVSNVFTTSSTISITNSTSSNSTATGALVVGGGVGIAGDVYATAYYGDGANLTGVTASGFSGGTVPGLTSFTFTGTGSASTSTITGAVRISAGLGVQGAIYANNFNGVIVPAGGVAPGANRFVRTEANGYAYVNYINSNTSNNENPTVSQFIVQNATDGFYRKASLDHVKTQLTLNTTSSVQHGSLGIGTAASGTSGEIRATNNITAFFSSDAKFKENVRDIPNALDKVVAIGGKLFAWTDAYLKNHGGQDDYFLRKEDFGVIAQDVERVFPQAVRKRPDGSLAVDYEKLSALAFAAIVELTKRVNALEKDI